MLSKKKHSTNIVGSFLQKFLNQPVIRIPQCHCMHRALLLAVGALLFIGESSVLHAYQLFQVEHEVSYFSILID